VCLTAQQGGNKSFRRLDLLDELVSEKRELEQRVDMNSVDKELHDAYASRKVTFEYYLYFSYFLFRNHF